MKERRYRSLTKAISWRITGTLDTFIISYLVTGKPKIAIAISGIEVFTKIILYYFHERFWNRLNFGRKQLAAPPNKLKEAEEKGDNKEMYYLPSILEFIFKRWRKN
jgi:uncharacterized membrane protein